MLSEMPLQEAEPGEYTHMLPEVGMSETLRRGSPRPAQCGKRHCSAIRKRHVLYGGLSTALVAVSFRQGGDVGGRSSPISGRRSRNTTMNGTTAKIYSGEEER